MKEKILNTALLEFRIRLTWKCNDVFFDLNLIFQ